MAVNQQLTSEERTLLQSFVDMEDISTYADPKKFWAAYAIITQKARALLSESPAPETPQVRCTHASGKHTLETRCTWCNWPSETVTNGPVTPPETGVAPGVLEVGLNVDETMVILNHPKIDQDERGGHILFTAAEARHLGELLLSKAAECRAEKP
jgi:hypothetical protein